MELLNQNDVVVLLCSHYPSQSNKLPNISNIFNCTSASMNLQQYRSFLTILSFLALIGCGGGNSNNSSENSIRISGVVSGLSAGEQITLTEKDQSVTILSNGKFTFPEVEIIGTQFLVYIANQPTNQICSLSNSSGYVTSTNTTEVFVSCDNAAPARSTLGNNQVPARSNLGPAAGCGCMSTWTHNGKTYTGGICGNPDNDANGPWCKTTNTCNGKSWSYCSYANSDQTPVPAPSLEFYSVGGTIEGLGDGKQIILQNRGSSNLTLSSNGKFTFAYSYGFNTQYDISILEQPANQICTIIDGAGTIAGEVTAVQIRCKFPGFNPPRSCTCTSNWSYANSAYDGCANPDHDPNGPWCKTTASCFGKAWAYCSAN